MGLNEYFSKDFDNRIRGSVSSIDPKIKSLIKSILYVVFITSILYISFQLGGVYTCNNSGGVMVSGYKCMNASTIEYQYKCDSAFFHFHREELPLFCNLSSGLVCEVIK